MHTYAHRESACVCACVCMRECERGSNENRDTARAKERPPSRCLNLCNDPPSSTTRLELFEATTKRPSNHCLAWRNVGESLYERERERERERAGGQCVWEAGGKRGTVESWLAFEVCPRAFILMRQRERAERREGGERGGVERLSSHGRERKREGLLSRRLHWRHVQEPLYSCVRERERKRE